MTNNQTLGQYLEAARQNAGLSIRQLAEAAQVHRTVVGRLVLDQVNDPKPRHLISLAEVLEVKAGELFERAGLPAPAQGVTVEALLRTEYDLPPAAIKEAKAQIADIIARYGKQPDNKKGGSL